MIRIWKTSEEGRTEEIDTLEPGSWVVLVDPEPQELTRVRLEAGIELADMRDALRRGPLFIHHHSSFNY